MRRDKNGKVIDSIFAKFRSWWLGRQLRRGKIPRGRGGIKMTSNEALAVLSDTVGIFPEIVGTLSARVIRKNGDIEDLGLLSVMKITTAFRDYMVDSLQDSTTYPMDVFKYHASGTDNTAEANTQTALVAEVETRVAGTQTEGATADIFKSVATITYTATRSIYEHGLFSASTGGTLMDRSVIGVITVDSGDKIEWTYQGTFNAEA